MTRSTAVRALGIAFVAYFVLRGVLAPAPSAHPIWAMVAIAVFVMGAGAALVLPAADQRPVGPAAMTRCAAIAVAAAAGVLPLIATGFVRDQDGLIAVNATWFIGAAGAMLAVVCVRRHPIVAWAGVAALSTTSSIVLESFGVAMRAGLVGSILWVVIAQLMIALAERAHQNTEHLAELRTHASAWRAAQLSAARARRERVSVALSVAGPVLTRVIETGGAISDEERNEAVFAEATLRDEIRGTRLLDDGVRREIAAARRRGAAVSLYDEGELDHLTAEELAEVRRQIAEVIGSSTSERIIVRTSSRAGTAATIVGRREEDEEDVDLWHEIEVDPGR
ncbi:hypothetical protein [Microbacterium amylolyticum]|uniref:Uncharacterized protein n=1 Tax=Microbacterium amylolyticum TaxID=936337 RepID=A0ABS4ZK25_9MICO|nr:hypothetical protein [Microbacterium amylolyticum]MBP2437552.1 hypothetical protein [Microbacterium amylolyticum]